MCTFVRNTATSVFLLKLVLLLSIFLKSLLNWCMLCFWKCTKPYLLLFETVLPNTNRSGNCNNETQWYVISGFRRYQMRSAVLWNITKSRCINPYRFLGINYRPHLQESGSYLKVWPMGCPETSTRNYHSMLHKIPDECGSQLQ